MVCNLSVHMKGKIEENSIMYKVNYIKYLFMILSIYIGNPEDSSAEKLLELVNEFSKREGYKINI